MTDTRPSPKSDEQMRAYLETCDAVPDDLYPLTSSTKLVAAALFAFAEPDERDVADAHRSETDEPLIHLHLVGQRATSYHEQGTPPLEAVKLALEDAELTIELADNADHTGPLNALASQ